MRFVLCCSCVGLLWLVLLPWLSRLEPFANRLQWLEEKQIDAGAMYYTELEALRPVLKRMERQHRVETEISPERSR